MTDDNRVPLLPEGRTERNFILTLLVGLFLLGMILLLYLPLLVSPRVLCDVGIKVCYYRY